MSSKNLATFAAGCFWGVENNFMSLDGVVETSVGYMGGKFKNPTYFDICSGLTGHAEVVNVIFDPEKISFKDLCKFFFQIHDPSTLNRQGPDIGTQYRSAIFYYDDEQKIIALDLIKEMNSKDDLIGKVVTQVDIATDYYVAEDYHQKYILKNNLESCGG
tara:strand:+ start:4167 stop:4646 length:480 start_codon:yes stop_codon:yes gene_type:complete